jgi:hypothetical protein
MGIQHLKLKVCGNMIRQYQQAEQEYVLSKKFFYLLFLVISIIIIVFIVYTILRPSKVVCGDNICDTTENQQTCCLDCGCPAGKECYNNVCVALSRCGNGICEVEENCYDCPKDCKCKTNEYCSKETKECMLPQCGNGKCEPFEGPDNCCIDCKCTIPGEFCNLTTKKCEIQEINISDERIRQLVNEYFQNQNKTIISMEISSTFAWGDKIGKLVKVEIKDEWIYTVLVTEEGEVIELPTP